MTTATLPRRIFRPVATPPARRSMLIGFFGTLAVGLVALVAASAAIGFTSEGQILSGVRVGGVELGGLTRAEAERRLEEQLPSLRAGTATIVAGEVTETVSFAELGRGYELDAMLDAAAGVGRNSGLIADGIARLRSLARPTSLPVIVHPFDPASLDAAAERVARAVTIDPVEAAVVDRDGFEVRPSADGRQLEAAAVRSAIADAAGTTSPDDSQAA